MTSKKILQQLLAHRQLSFEQAREVIVAIGRGEWTDAEIASFLTIYLMRSIGVEELGGFRQGLLEMCVPVQLDTEPSVDIVGTGGDGKNTFNISTLACFVVAGTGQKVTKHGNYGASTVSGASNVMEYLGYHFTNREEILRRQLDAGNFCFLHAPLFHPALKNVGHIRRQLGIRTFFNLLGPLVNPASPACSVIGVYNAETTRIYNYLLQQGTQDYTLVHSLDGYDEISLTNDVKIVNRQGEKVYTAFAIGKRTVAPQDISGGHDVAEAARIFTQILQQKGTWAQNAVVLANAAVALDATGRYSGYEQAYEAAVESLESGKAYDCFTKVLAVS
jgi:anthranilate phosphoribosyltransferase